MTPSEFAAKLKEIGLKPISTHQAMITLANADALYADAETAGFRYFVVPIPLMSHFTFDPETKKMGMSLETEARLIAWN